MAHSGLAYAAYTGDQPHDCFRERALSPGWGRRSTQSRQPRRFPVWRWPWQFPAQGLCLYATSPSTPPPLARAPAGAVADAAPASKRAWHANPPAERGEQESQAWSLTCYDTCEFVCTCRVYNIANARDLRSDTL